MSIPTSRSSNSTAPFSVIPDTPAALGFRMPAEWERQSAVWFSWPVREATWPGHYHLIPAKFAEIIATVSRFQHVHVNVSAALQEQALRLFREAKADLAQVTLHDHPNNEVWCRDHGPIFVRNDATGEVALTDWIFNAWGGKVSPINDDDAIPSRVATALGCRRFQPGIVLEGGSIDVNGKGALLTTEVCLLNKNRNPELSRSMIEQKLRDYLGVRTIHWLGKGIEGDDTDGHVDDLTRFFRPDAILTVVESDSGDVNYRALFENRERLDDLRTEAGGRYEIVELPMPAPCVTDGQRLPASYANFLIMNQAVLVPVFRQKRKDEEALDILRACFPGREVVPIDCRDWVIGRGTLHCISQQQPA